MKTLGTQRVDTRKVAYSVILAAIAIALSPFNIPIALGPIVRPLPWQHMVNVLGAVLVGPWYALAVALVAAIVRNAIGTGTLFAFPGGMIGAFLAGWTYRLTRNLYLAALGEIIGTGVIAALFSTLIWAPTVMNRPMAATALIIPFSISTIVGSVLGIVGVLILERARVIEPRAGAKAV
ncbi:MAG: energy coupling factor transporter S component ThiW [Chloroflexota bacterium]